MPLLMSRYGLRPVDIDDMRVVEIVACLHQLINAS